MLLAEALMLLPCPTKVGAQSRAPACTPAFAGEGQGIGQG